VTNILHTSFEMSWDVRPGSLQAYNVLSLSVSTYRSSHPLTSFQDLAPGPRLQIKFSLFCWQRNTKYRLKRDKKMKAFHTFASEFSSTFQTKTLGKIACIHSELQSSEVCIAFAYRSHLPHCLTVEKVYKRRRERNVYLYYNMFFCCQFTYLIFL
jgi:hypothetical protein